VSVNRVTACGRLGRDPEIKKTPNGKLVANMSIACEEKWKDRDGAWQKRTEWIPIVIWGDGLVETIETYLKKGDQVYVEGKFQTRKWEKSGETRYATEVVVDGFAGKVEFFFPKKGGDREDDSRDGGRSYGSSSSTSRKPASTQRSMGSDLDDEIPF